ncbi:hypothetical protein [Aquincola sp. J276]|uniref:hypothetical protein n=1 Tax=Aquincola sp. J276 TaxID=2898432 RepID=UPI002151DC36|nr:hypothetical protein [Aquincola sp. J276]MCR5869237.1 hypothetical protein [Aquincola sp. J276]
MNPAPSRPRRPRPALWWLLVALLLALPLYGASAVVLKLLGPAHRHLQPALPQLTAHGHEHAHTHDGIERHHHDIGDDSIVTADGHAVSADAVEAADEAGAGSATLPLALGFALRLRPPAARRRAWPRATRSAWRNGWRCRLERPPARH